MYPRWHILLGAIFSLLVWLVSPSLHWSYVLTIFLSSVLIDFDHYVAAVQKTKNMSLKKAFIFYDKLEEKVEKEYRKGKKIKGPFHLFHTLEFHILIGILAIFFNFFFFVFIGMIFHSLIDVAWMTYKDRLFVREFFFINWLRNK